MFGFGVYLVVQFVTLFGRLLLSGSTSHWTQLPSASRWGLDTCVQAWMRFEGCVHACKLRPLSCGFRVAHMPASCVPLVCCRMMLIACRCKSPCKTQTGDQSAAAAATSTCHAPQALAEGQQQQQRQQSQQQQQQASRHPPPTVSTPQAQHSAQQQMRRTCSCCSAVVAVSAAQQLRLAA